MNNRRKLIVALGAGAFSAPFASFAQPQGKVWRIGILSPGLQPTGADRGIHSHFVNGLRDLGYVEGKNIAIEWRYADEKFERLPALAAELVQLKVDIIATAPSSCVRAAQQATTVIPIVMFPLGNPVANGFAASLAHPGGNITGVSNQSEELDAKRLELLMSAAPKAMRLAEIVNPANPSTMKRIPNLEAVVKKAGKEFSFVGVRAENEFAGAFDILKRERVGAILVSSDFFFTSHAPRLAELALKHRLPSIFGARESAEAGGLMSYGADRGLMYRRVATYVDKILKGAKPGDLPIEQADKFEMVINLKTAKALGIKIPDVIMLRADKVIE